MISKKRILSIVAAASAIPSVLASVAIESDTLQGLPWVGSDVGTFLKNLAPGIGAFIIILGVFGGVAAIVYSIVNVIRGKMSV